MLLRYFKNIKKEKSQPEKWQSWNLWVYLMDVAGQISWDGLIQGKVSMAES